MFLYVGVGGGGWGGPASFPRFEATLNSSRLLCTEAAEVFIIVADVTLLALLHDVVSTDGVIAHWRGRRKGFKRIVDL